MKPTKLKTYYKLMDDMGREGNVKFPTEATAREAMNLHNDINLRLMLFYKKMGADASSAHVQHWKDIVTCTHIEGSNRKPKKGVVVWKITATNKLKKC